MSGTPKPPVSPEDQALLASQARVRKAYLKAMRRHARMTMVQAICEAEHLLRKALIHLVASYSGRPCRAAHRRTQTKFPGNQTAIQRLHNRRAARSVRETGVPRPEQGSAQNPGSDDSVRAVQAYAALPARTEEPATALQSAAEAPARPATRPIELWEAQRLAIDGLAKDPELYAKPQKLEAFRQLIERFLAPPYPDAQEARVPYHVRLERRFAAASGSPSVTNRHDADALVDKMEGDPSHRQNGADR